MTMSVLDRPDQTKVYTQQEIVEARAQFLALRAKGYFAYREDGGSGGSGTVVKDLDEVKESESVVFVPLMVGG